MPNREIRRHMAQNGQPVPIITISFYNDGGMIVDHHPDITKAQVNEFLRSVADRLPFDAEG